MTVENTNLIDAGGRIIRARRAYSGNVIMTLLVNDHRHIAQVPFIHHGLIDRSLMGNHKVLVRGHIYVSPSYDEITRRQNNVPTFLVDDIQLRKTQMEEAFGVRGRFCGTDYFMGKFTGTVSRVIHTQNENWGEMIVMVDGYNGNAPSSVLFNYYLKGKLPSIDSFKEGDRVAILSSVHTTTKTIREEERTFVNLGVEDIVKINESADEEPAAEVGNEDAPRRENSRERRRRRRQLMIMHEENRGSAPDEPEKGLPTTDEVNAGLVKEEPAEVEETVANSADEKVASDATATTSASAPTPATAVVPTGEEEETTLYNDPEENSAAAIGGTEDPDTDSTDSLRSSAASSYGVSHAYPPREETAGGSDEDYDDSDFLSQFKK